MYPHQKLEWTQEHLEEKLAGSPDDTAARAELARVCLSRALYHHGGEAVAATALQHAKRVVHDEPENAEGHVLCGAALVALERPDGAQRYLDEALRLDPTRADLHLALGALYRAQKDLHLAIRHLENACRASPESWECHLLLGRTLAERARQVGGTRLVERAQFHLVQALAREPSPDLLPVLMRDLGLLCLQTGRYHDAEKLFVRLRQHPRFSNAARKHLGQVAFGLGKYKGAIQHYRQYLEGVAAHAHGDDAGVLAQIGLAYLHLGELAKAREHCNKALLLDPDLLAARHALGCVLVEEGQVADAIKVFRDTLQEHPDDMVSYVELARTRRRAGDVAWLQRALEVEVSGFDQLPPTGGEQAPRTVARRRIAVLLEELKVVGPSSVGAILGAIERTEDEGLRFAAWETACALTAGHVADELGGRLREAGRCYSVGLARNALAAAAYIPEPALTAGLHVTMEDIQRAAVERRGNAGDLTAHRRAVEAERETARAWQAILLLAIATRRSRSARELFGTWGQGVDAELGVAVLAAQATCGEPEAARALHRRAQERGASVVIDKLLARVTPPAARGEPQPVGSGDIKCSACGRGTAEGAPLFSGTRAVLCSVCVSELVRDRRESASPESASCHLCGRTAFESRGLWHKAGIDACAHCLEFSVGLREREEVDRFLASW
ncbi:MAG: tetratricopeptide repeat protein [Deltaproteobacteria bacterium]|nr:tetratricopeptide repeat protein [Deltaproteobacteria bacterium]